MTSVVAIIQAIIFYGGLIATSILGFLSFLANFSLLGIVLVVLCGLIGPIGVLIQRYIDHYHVKKA